MYGIIIRRITLYQFVFLNVDVIFTQILDLSLQSFDSLPIAVQLILQIRNIVLKRIVEYLLLNFVYLF